MAERIRRPDIPNWIEVLLSNESIRVQGTYASPFRVGLIVVSFWFTLLSSFFWLLFLIAMSALPFSPVLSFVVLMVLAFGLRYALLDWLCVLLGPTLCVEFTRDRQIVIRRSPGFVSVFKPEETFQIAFGVNEPDLLQELRRMKRLSPFQSFQKRLLDDARTIEFRFGAEQHVVATFSQRRRAEEFVVVCNWALNELRKLDDDVTTTLPAA